MVGDEEVVSLSHAKAYEFFRFCVMLWKDEREPAIKYCLGGQVDGEPMEVEWNIFTGFTNHIAALQQSPRVPVKNERKTRRFHRTDHLHVDV